MAKQDTQTSTSWRPAPGETITGRLERVSQHNAGYGVYPVLEIATESETVTVHAFHDVLKAELVQHAPKIGDTLTIRYDGKHPEKGYHRYRVDNGDGAVTIWFMKLRW